MSSVREFGVVSGPIVNVTGVPAATCVPSHSVNGHSFKLQVVLKLTNTDPFATWFAVIENATLDGIRAMRSVLGAIGSLPIMNFRE